MIFPRPLLVTYLGHPVDHAEPESISVHAMDMMYALSHQYRYGGHIPVLDVHHLALCVMLADAPAKAYAGAHDLHEAYFPDVIRQIKAMIPGYDALEERHMAHIHRLIGLAWPPTPEIQVEVKRVDRRAVAVEAEVWGHRHPDHYAHHAGGPATDHERSAGEYVAKLRTEQAWMIIDASIRDAGGSIPW